MAHIPQPVDTSPYLEQAPLMEPDAGSNAPPLLMTQGLPEMDAAEKNSGSNKATGLVALLLVLPLAIGVGIAYAVAQAKPANLDAKIDFIREWDLQFLYLAILVLARMVAFQNLYPMIFKARVMRGSSGNLRANMYLYRIAGPSEQAPQLVLLDAGGDAGAYNRANRSLHHMTENIAPTLLMLLGAGVCYPRASLVLSALFSAGRCMHAVGYTKGYGAHAPGFSLALLSTSTLEGLCLVIALKAWN